MFCLTPSFLLPCEQALGNGIFAAADDDRLQRIQVDGKIEGNGIIKRGGLRTLRVMSTYVAVFQCIRGPVCKFEGNFEIGAQAFSDCQGFWLLPFEVDVQPNGGEKNLIDAVALPAEICYIPLRRGYLPCGILAAQCVLQFPWPVCQDRFPAAAIVTYKLAVGRGSQSSKNRDAIGAFHGEIHLAGIIQVLSSGLAASAGAAGENSCAAGCKAYALRNGLPIVPG